MSDLPELDGNDNPLFCGLRQKGILDSECHCVGNHFECPHAGLHAAETDIDPDNAHDELAAWLEYQEVTRSDRHYNEIYP